MSTCKHFTSAIWLAFPVLLLALLFSGCATRRPATPKLQELFLMSGEEYYQMAMDYARDRSYWADPFEAFHFFRKAAELGHPGAQDRTGWGYQYGLGTERDLYQAAKWYRRAAEAGNAQAQTSLGVFLYMGLGGEKDREEALYWTRQAAEQNHPAGLNNMGSMYERGEVVDTDYNQAFAYYQKSAELGYMLGKSNLGTMYERGLGVKRDTDKAFSLFRESCTRENRYGFAGCFNMLKNYPEVAAEEEDYKKAFQNLQDACYDYQGVACDFLGTLYLNGRWVNQDPGQAAYFYRKGCILGISSSCGEAGELYYSGNGARQDRALGIVLLDEACRNGDVASCRAMAAKQEK